MIRGKSGRILTTEIQRSAAGASIYNASSCLQPQSYIRNGMLKTLESLVPVVTVAQCTSACIVNEFLLLVAGM